MAEILVTGAGGQLGSHLLHALELLGASVLGTVSPTGPAPYSGTTTAVDLCDATALGRLFEQERPRQVVHAAALTSAAQAERDPSLAHRLNVELTRQLATLCKEHGSWLLLLSTDMVFAGDEAPYGEADPAHPQSTYGLTKLAAESEVLRQGGACVARLPLLYGVPRAPRRSTFVDLVSALQQGRPPPLFADEYRTPLALADAAHALQRLIAARAAGLLHLGGPERLSRLQMGRRVAAALRLPDAPLGHAQRADYPGPDPRPADLSLRNDRYQGLFHEAVGRPMQLALHDLPQALTGYHAGFEGA